MSAISELAEFVNQATFAMLPSETREHVKMHILDTVGAMLAGPRRAPVQPGQSYFVAVPFCSGGHGRCSC